MLAQGSTLANLATKHQKEELLVGPVRASVRYLATSHSSSDEFRILPRPFTMSAMKVPEDIVQNWEMGGNKVALISAYLQVADELTDAVYAAAGVEGNSPAADVAFIKDSEWEDLVLNLKVNENALSLVQRSRVRQCYATCQVAALTQDPGQEEAEGGQVGDAVPQPLAAQPAEVTGQGAEAAVENKEAPGQPSTPQITGHTATTAAARQVEKDGGDDDPSSSSSSTDSSSEKKKKERSAQEENQQAKKSKKSKKASKVDGLSSVKLGEVALQGARFPSPIITLARIMKEGKRRYREKEGQILRRSSPRRGSKPRRSWPSLMRQTLYTWILRSSGRMGTGSSRPGGSTRWCREPTAHFTKSNS